MVHWNSSLVHRHWRAAQKKLSLWGPWEYLFWCSSQMLGRIIFEYSSPYKEFLCGFNQKLCLFCCAFTYSFQSRNTGFIVTMCRRHCLSTEQKARIWGTCCALLFCVLSFFWWVHSSIFGSSGWSRKLLSFSFPSCTAVLWDDGSVKFSLRDMYTKQSYFAD